MGPFPADVLLRAVSLRSPFTVEQRRLFAFRLATLLHSEWLQGVPQISCGFMLQGFFFSAIESFNPQKPTIRIDCNALLMENTRFAYYAK